MDSPKGGPCRGRTPSGGGARRGRNSSCWRHSGWSCGRRGGAGPEEVPAAEREAGPELRLTRGSCGKGPESQRRARPWEAGHVAMQAKKLGLRFWGRRGLGGLNSRLREAALGTGLLGLREAGIWGSLPHLDGRRPGGLDSRWGWQPKVCLSSDRIVFFRDEKYNGPLCSKPAHQRPPLSTICWGPLVLIEHQQEPPV